MLDVDADVETASALSVLPGADPELDLELQSVRVVGTKDADFHPVRPDDLSEAVGPRGQLLEELGQEGRIADAENWHTHCVVGGSWGRTRRSG